MSAFILASSSPRRRELLRAADYEFEVIASSAREVLSAAFTVRELTVWNATRKALAVARAHPHAVVLGADTLVALEGQVIGKPADLTEAAAILGKLSGRVHTVCSAVFLYHLRSKQALSFYQESSVRFRELGSQAIADYLAKIQPLDKAGAYSAQDDNGSVIAEIIGSFTNVVGLPMEKTAAALSTFGVNPNPR